MNGLDLPNKFIEHFVLLLLLDAHLLRFSVVFIDCLYDNFCVLVFELLVVPVFTKISKSFTVLPNCLPERVLLVKLFYLGDISRTYAQRLFIFAILVNLVHALVKLLLVLS